MAHIMARAHPGVVFLHPANGGARTAVEGAILKSLGVVTGAPDLLLWHGGQSFALEIKTEDGRTSEAQLEMLNRLSEAGCPTAIAHGVDKAIAVLEGWQLLRGRIR